MHKELEEESVFTTVFEGSMSGINEIREKVKEEQPLELDEAILLARHGDSDAIPILWEFYKVYFDDLNVKKDLIESFKYVYDEDVMGFFGYEYSIIKNNDNNDNEIIGIVQILSSLPWCNRLENILFQIQKTSIGYKVERAVEKALNKFGIFNIPIDFNHDFCDFREKYVSNDPGVAKWHSDIDGWCEDQ